MASTELKFAHMGVTDQRIQPLTDVIPKNSVTKRGEISACRVIDMLKDAICNDQK